ncbi:ribosomal RNA-processing protein 7 homolog A-like [Panonychus citri]|uniref:ribosomal RNA-processing protein 7 homolog A-like n=1 Tax=Panonychus citri TaxID=50023 RepID=UPI002307E169|nr:ribosomal RNA-processing protein 7 homolog A-like [Panonychus citri]
MQEIKVLNVVVNKASEVVRHVFVKPLASDKEKSVILINLPGFCDAVSVKKSLSVTFGSIKSIRFHSSIETIGMNEATFDGGEISPIYGYRAAVVVFKDQKGIQSMNQLIESKKILYLYGQGKPLTGLRRWEHCYNESILDLEATKKDITNYIARYDKRVRLEKENAKAMEGVADEDGWIKVSRHGKKPFLPNADYLDKKITEKMQKKRAKSEIFPRTEKVKSDVL